MFLDVCLGMATWKQTVVCINVLVNLLCNNDPVCLDEVTSCVFDGESLEFCGDSFMQEHANDGPTPFYHKGGGK